MTRTRLRLVACAIGMLLPIQLGAYHHFRLAGAAGPVKWRTLGVVLTTDSTPAAALTETTTATTTWNNIATAQNVFGTPVAGAVDFTGANQGTAWGMLTADGKQEVVFDADGSGLTALGLDPADTNGYCPSRKELVGGLPTITDSFFIVNTQRTDFDRLSTLIHELGHMQGLAHSSVGMYNTDASYPSGGSLDPIAFNSVPTMHPFSLPTANTNRRTPEPDDAASLSELYPEATFTSTLGSISGKVTRCITDAVMAGVNVRVVNVSTPTTQLTRFTGFDGNTTGSYTINGLPPGNYKVIVEPMGANDFTLNRFGSPPTRADADFPTEYYNPPDEDTCAEEVPDTAVNVAVAAAATAADKNVKVSGVALSFVVDDTGSMSEEIAAVRSILTSTINLIKASGKPFPRTAILTFSDSVTRRVISDNPTRLQTVVNSLSASGGGDCPEASNAALLAAGNLLAKNSVVMLFTDADSRPDGPARSTVTSQYRAKSLRLFTLLSGTCTGTVTPSGEGDETALFSDQIPTAAEIEMQQGPAQPPDPDAAPIAKWEGYPSRVASAVAEEYRLPPTLGVEPAPRTFSEISADTGGFFVALPGVNSGNSQRYINTGTNLAVSAVLPAVALVNPGNLVRGISISVEVSGSNTNFTSNTTFAVSGTGVTVSNVQALSPTLLRVTLTIAADATLGFRDVTATTPLGATDTEVAVGTGSLNIAATPTTPSNVGVSPSSGNPGQTLNVTITGVNTAFVNGTSTANFGSGITVNSLTVTSTTVAIANITIAPTATIAYRRVSVTTGSQVANDFNTESGSFRVAPSTAVIASIAQVIPNTGTVGSTLNVIIVGNNTSFAAGTTGVAFGGTGITVNSVSVASTTSVTVNISIAAGATLGFRDVVVTTGTQVASILNGFQVLPVSTCTYAIAPTSGTAGENGSSGTFALTATGLNCQWTVVSNSGPAITFSPASGTGSGTITYVVLPNFRPAARTVSLTVGGQTFSVLQSAATGAANRRLVRLLYYFFLGRVPTEAEITFQVNAGLSPARLAEGFFNAEEFNLTGKFVAGIYLGLLGRDAEYGGWVFQRNALSGSIGLRGPLEAHDIVVGAFITTLEYQARYGNPNMTDFVKLLFRYILLREASTGEAEFQAGTGLTRVALARNFLNSAEFRTGLGPRMTAFLIYATLLQRDPSAGELTFLASQIGKTPLLALMEAYVNSSEFLANYN